MLLRAKFIIILLLFAQFAFAVDNIFTGATNSNFGVATNWSLGVTPTASDGNVARFNASSPNCSLANTQVCNNIDFTGYTHTFAFGTFLLTVSGNVTLDAGMTLTSSSTGQLAINAACTFTSNGKSLPSRFVVTTAVTITFADDLTLTGALNSGSSSGTVFNSHTLHIQGDYPTVGGGGILSGTTAFVVDGTGNQTWTGNCQIRNNLTINKSSGTLTLGGSISYSTGVFTYTAGTIDYTTNSPLLSVAASTTFTINGSGWSFYSGTFTGTPTITINGSNLLNFSNTLTTNSSTTFAGTIGWTAATWTSTTAGLSHSLKNSITYTVTGSLTLRGTAASRITIASDDGTLKAILTLNQGATQDVSFITATRLNSSAGQTIWCWSPTLTSDLNWNSLLASSMQTAFVRQ